MKVHTASDYEFNAWIVKPADFDPFEEISGDDDAI